MADKRKSNLWRVLKSDPSNLWQMQQRRGNHWRDKMEKEHGRNWKKNHYNRYSNIRIAFSKIRQKNIDVNEKGDESRHDFLLNRELGKLQTDVFCTESLRYAFSGRICSEVWVEDNVLCMHEWQGWCHCACKRRQMT